MQDLADAVLDARERTFALVEDLDDGQLVGPQLPTVNPLLWEIGHVAWFQERWVLRREPGAATLLPDADRLFDSAAIAHEVRWSLAYPSRERTLQYLRDVRDSVLERMKPSDEYFVRLTVFHEDMHGESFLMTRQTLGYAAPRALLGASPSAAPSETGRRRDIHCPGGTFLLGADRRAAFVFDNEKWAHPVPLAPFAISRDTVTQGEFADFVDDGGYARRDLWSEAGRRWLDRERAEHPLHWSRDGGAWTRRVFDARVPLERDLAMVHVNRHEAQAWCAWAGRRLPTEAEWEAAASMDGDAKRRHPWGDDAPRAEHARLDARSLTQGPSDALSAGDSALGCRQMTGNVWEWTASAFVPYPGFVKDPYEEYSEPWFHTHDVLRGGSFATRGRLLRNTWRNFYMPGRRDVFAGFRTCAGRLDAAP